MVKKDVPFERHVRAALTRLHDIPYLQTHPLGGLHGKALQSALTAAVEALRSGTEGTSGRTQRLLALRYVEALDSRDVAARLGVSMGEYYREHAVALVAVASLLVERLAMTPAPTSAPAAPTLARTAPLPRRIDAFVGRVRDVEEVRRLLAATPLVTLVGPGGVGKTRLALEVADGLSAGQVAVWFVELTPLAEPGLVAPAVGAAVGAPVSGDPTKGLVEWLQGRGGLLLLDNCEHLLESCAALAETLLATCPRLQVLATSREPLGVAGEVVWSLPPLDAEHAVALFSLRAAAARQGFGVTSRNREAVGRICARLDGLPLGIELAAARVRALSPAEIADRLERALDLLTAGGRRAPARHQTLRAAVDWSHDLLDAEERQLFRRLSVFAGWFDLDAAEAVAGAKPELLARLVDRSLAQAEPRDERTRFRLLETLRQYAGERLGGQGEEAAFRDRHLG